MAQWEYCRLSLRSNVPTAGRFTVTYFHEETSAEVQEGAIADLFFDWGKALSYLGEQGWQAFQIDNQGDWFFRRRFDWDSGLLDYEDEDEE